MKIDKHSKLDQLLRKWREILNNMSDAEQKELRDAQRKSFVRAMTTPCEHGVLDFETCPDCRKANAQNGS